MGTRKLYGDDVTSGLGAPAPKSAVEKFKQLVDVVSRKHFQHDDLTVFGKEVDGNISDIRFMDSLVVIQKAPDDPNWGSYPKQDLLFVTREDSDDAVRSFQSRMAREDPIP